MGGNFAASIRETIVLPGLEVLQTATAYTGDSLVPAVDFTLNAGNSGSLTTRTADDDGEITAADAGHDITTGMTVDVHWTDSGVNYCRYGMTAGTVAGTAIPVTGGAGNVLPAEATTVIVDEVVALDNDFDGDNLSLFRVVVGQKAQVVYLDSGDAVLAHPIVDSTAAWGYPMSGSNPLTGNPVDEIHLSNGSTSPCRVRQSGILNAQV